MSSTLDKVSAEVAADLQLAEPKKQNLRKTFNLLKTHAAAVANFTLQWQDLEDHFLSIHNSIQVKLQELEAEKTQLATTLQSQACFQQTLSSPVLLSQVKSEETQINSEEIQLIPTLQSEAKSQETQFNSTETQLTPTHQSQDKGKETQSTSKEAQLAPTIEIQFSSETQLIPTLKSQAKSKETQPTILQSQAKTEESVPENPSVNGIPIDDGKALLLHLNEHHLKEHESMRDDLYNALKISVDSGKLVLEAMKWFYSLEKKKGDIDPEVAAVRRSCVLLLEELMRVKPVIKAEVREEAVKLALECKAKLSVGVENSWKIFGFLLLLSAFGLTGEFQSEEVLDLFVCVLQRKHAPELFQALGFADKASDFIQKLISQDKRLDAIRFIYAYEMVDKFPPVPLLKAHLKLAKKIAMSCKGKNSIKAQDEATNKEIAAIRAVIKCIDNYQLGSQLSPENLRNLIKHLTEKRKERKATATALGPKAQVRQQSANKRTAPDNKAQLNQQNRNKRPRSDAAFKPAGFYAGQSAELLNPSAGTSAAAAMPNVSFGHSRQPTHHQPESSFTGRHARYLTPSAGQYSFARYSPDPPHASLPAGRYGLLHSRSLTGGPFGLMSPTRTGQYGMADSIPGTARMSSSAGHYGSSIAANGSTGRIGSAGTLAAMGYAPNSSPDRPIPYYPGHPPRPHSQYDRSVWL